MYQQTNLGRESKRFTLDGLRFATGIKSQDTVRVALAGLVRKGHVTILDKKGCRHYGILYRVQMPHEIRALNQDPAYVAEQERLAEEVKIKKAKAKQPKAKQPKLQFEEPDQQQSAGENPTAAAPEMPVTTAAPVAAVGPLAEASNLSEKPVIRVTESTHLDEAENLKIRVTETQKLGSQNALILFHVLKHVLNMGNLMGGSGIPMRACMCEAQPSDIATPSAAAPEPPVSAPLVSSPANSEGDSRHCMPRATVAPENTDLGRVILLTLNWQEVILDHEMRATLRTAMSWFEFKQATPEEILRFRVWRFDNCKTAAPPLPWLRDDFNRYRASLSAPEATGTAAQRVPAAPIKFPTKAGYESVAAQMAQAYIGKGWESVSEQLAVFKGYVLRAGLAWNDDLANEIFC